MEAQNDVKTHVSTTSRAHLQLSFLHGSFWIILNFASIYCFPLDGYLSLKDNPSSYLVFYSSHLASIIPLLSLIIAFLSAGFLMKWRMRDILVGFLIVVVFQLLILLVIMKKSFLDHNPFSDVRTVYLHYFDMYFSLIFIAAIGCCFWLYWKSKDKDFLPLHHHLYAFLILGGSVVLAYMSYTLLLMKEFVLFFAIIVGSFCFYSVLMHLQKIRAFISRSSVFRFLCNHYQAVFLSCIYLLAFAIRYFWGAHVVDVHGSEFIFASDDGRNYHLLAKSFVETSVFDKTKAFHFGGYGYWVFLSIIYKFFGIGSFKAVVFFQSLFGATIPISIFFIVKRILTHHLKTIVAILAAILSAVSVNLIFTGSLICMEAMFIPFVYICLLFALKIFDSHDHSSRWHHYMFLGVLLGLTYLFRKEAVLLVVPITFLFTFFLLRRKAGFKSFLCVLFILVGFSVPPLINKAHNYQQYGTFTTGNNQLAYSFGIEREQKILVGMGFNPFKDVGRSLKVFLENKIKVTSLLLQGTFTNIPRYIFFPNFGFFDFFYAINPMSNDIVFKYIHPYTGYARFYAGFISLLGFMFLLFNRKFKKNIRGFHSSLIVIYMVLTVLFYSFILVHNGARHHSVLMPIFYIFFSMMVVFSFAHFKKILIVNRN